MLTWSEEKPEREGWYWWRTARRNGIFKVDAYDIEHDMILRSFLDKPQFAGPIPEPVDVGHQSAASVAELSERDGMHL